MYSRTARAILGAFTVFALVPSTSSALSIVINAGPTLAANPAALAAFGRAAAQFENALTDPITVTIDADLAPLGPGIIGSTSSVFLADSYDAIRNQMVADADADDTTVPFLPTSAQFTAFVPTGIGLFNAIEATKANLKAMGFTGLDAPMFGGRRSPSVASVVLACVAI